MSPPAPPDRPGPRQTAPSGGQYRRLRLHRKPTDVTTSSTRPPGSTGGQSDGHCRWSVRYRKCLFADGCCQLHVISTLDCAHFCPVPHLKSDLDIGGYPLVSALSDPGRSHLEHVDPAVAADHHQRVVVGAGERAAADGRDQAQVSHVTQRLGLTGTRRGEGQGSEMTQRAHRRTE